MKKGEVTSRVKVRIIYRFLLQLSCSQCSSTVGSIKLKGMEEDDDADEEENESSKKENERH
jgi:hypothetical protein